jgi:hypothetical protein
MLKFKPEDWKELRKYLLQWNEWQTREKCGDRPDFTSDSIYLVPLTIALLKAEKRMEILTWVLIVLTVILTYRTIF